MAISDMDAIRPAENREETTELFHLLSNQRRRHVIRTMDLQGELDKSALVDRVAEREFDVPVESVETDQRQRVYTSLHQTHLESLEEFGVVVLDGDVIRKGEWFDSVAAFLERAMIAGGMIEPPSFTDRMSMAVRTVLDRVQ